MHVDAVQPSVLIVLGRPLETQTMLMEGLPSAQRLTSPSIPGRIILAPSVLEPSQLLVSIPRDKLSGFPPLEATSGGAPSEQHLTLLSTRQPTISALWGVT